MAGKTKRDLTSLEFIVLGLLGLEPQTGYSIINSFEGGMYSWSASPGSIYPILKRLEKQGLIDGELEMAHETRPRKVYRLSGEGETLLDDWLREVPKMRPFHEQRELALLRFQFMEARFSIKQTLEWIENYLDVLRIADAHRVSYTEAVMRALDENGRSTVYRQLILENAMMEQNTLRTWLEMARSRLSVQAMQTGEFEAVDGDDRGGRAIAPKMK